MKRMKKDQRIGTMTDKAMRFNLPILAILYQLVFLLFRSLFAVKSDQKL